MKVVKLNKSRISFLTLFMKVSLSPDIILCDWLGLNHQLTNSLISHPGGLSPRVPLYIVSGKWPTTAIGFPLNTKALVSLTAFMACRSVPRVTNACPFIRPSFISRMSKLSAKYTIQAYLWPRKYSLYGTNLKQAENKPTTKIFKDWKNTKVYACFLFRSNSTVCKYSVKIHFISDKESDIYVNFYKKMKNMHQLLLGDL